MDKQRYLNLLKFSNLKNESNAHKVRQATEGMPYNIILNSPLNNKEDLVRIIHTVYAWMPTMIQDASIKKFETLDLNQLFKQAKAARENKINSNDENDLFRTLAILTNNHMVGASKVLTVINPKKYPIFDSRVIVGWNKFIEDFKIKDFKKLVNISINEKNGEPCIESYNYYKFTLSEWAKNINKEIRDIEFLLFYSGRRIAKENADKKKLNKNGIRNT